MKNKFTSIFINPFEKYSSRSLCIIGILAYLASSIISYYTLNHFQGIISVKSGGNATLLLSFYNNGIPIVLLTLALFLFGRTRNRNTRIIDILNVVMVSRIIIYLILLLLIEPFFIHGVLMKVEIAILDDDYMLNTLSSFDRTVLITFALLSLFCLVYFFYFFIGGIRFVINSKSKLDIFWILIIVFGLEIAFTLFHINQN